MKPVSIKTTLLVMSFLIIGNVTLLGQQQSTHPKVKSTVVYEEKSNKLISKKIKESETTYDTHGNILELIEYKDGKVAKHFQYEYDNENNKIKETEFDPFGRIDEYSVYIYEKGLRIEKTVFDQQGNVKQKKLYVYTFHQ
jgi:hypothetical protein